MNLDQDYEIAVEAFMQELLNNQKVFVHSYKTIEIKNYDHRGSNAPNCWGNNECSPEIVNRCPYRIESCGK
jgi:hypothetical protein